MAEKAVGVNDTDAVDRRTSDGQVQPYTLACCASWNTPRKGSERWFVWAALAISAALLPSLMLIALHWDNIGKALEVAWKAAMQNRTSLIRPDLSNVETCCLMAMEEGEQGRAMCGIELLDSIRHEINARPVNERLQFYLLEASLLDQAAREAKDPTTGADLRKRANAAIETYKDIMREVDDSTGLLEER